MAVPIELYLFTPLAVTLTTFQRHSGVKQLWKLNIVDFGKFDLIWVKLVYGCQIHIYMDEVIIYLTL